MIEQLNSWANVRDLAAPGFTDLQTRMHSGLSLSTREVI